MTHTRAIPRDGRMSLSTWARLGGLLRHWALAVCLWGLVLGAPARLWGVSGTWYATGSTSNWDSPANWESGIIAGGSTTDIATFAFFTGASAIDLNTNKILARINATGAGASTSLSLNNISSGSLTLHGTNIGGLFYALTSNVGYDNQMTFNLPVAITTTGSSTKYLEVSGGTTSVTFNSAISGSVNLVFRGLNDGAWGPTFTLNASNTYTGSTTVQGGWVRAATSASLGTATSAIILGPSASVTGIERAWLTLGSGTLSRAITLQNGMPAISLGLGTVTGGSATYSGNITGTFGGTLRILGVNGNVTLSGTGNTFTTTGPIQLDSGLTLTINDNARLGNNANDLTFQGSTLRTTATTTLNAGRTLTLSSGSGPDNTNTFQVDSGTTLTVAGLITGSAGVRVTGGGTMVMTRAGGNTYTGKTVVEGATLNLNTTGGAAIAAGAGDIILRSGGTLNVSRSDVTQIGSSVNLVMQGGTLTFVGTATTLNLGNLSLLENSTIDLGGGNIILTFNGIGTFTAGKTLTILNWGGLVGGGGNDRLRFNTTLTAGQMSQIYFAYTGGPHWGQAGNQIGASPTEITPVPEASTVALGLVMLAAAGYVALGYGRRSLCAQKG